MEAKNKETLWHIGTSAVDITPPPGLWMAGYAFRNRPAESAIHPLWVKAIALKDAQGTTAIIVGCDILGFPQKVAERIKSKVLNELHIHPANVILNSSHTHSGPVIEDSLIGIYPIDETEQIDKIKDYTAELERKVFQAITEANSNLCPAKLYYGKGISRFAVNRRNNKATEIENLSEFKGPVDYSVPVLFAKSNEDDSIIVILFSYACHGTVLGDYQWCGDYPGFAQTELQSIYPNALAVFLSGCCADIDPMPRLKLSLARQYGKELCFAVNTAIEDPQKEILPYLITKMEFISLDLEDPITKDELEKIANDPTQVDYKYRSAKYLLKELSKGKKFINSYEYPIQVWNLGGVPLIALGGEVVVDYAIFIKEKIGKDAIVLGYSNDVMGYIPSLRVLREGGYEGGDFQIGYGLPAKWKETIEERILSSVYRAWNEVSNI
ncbi:MAG: neutral/alkaline non-lysosomal ceramidase N-terminal domain-containing protein [Candidatus Hydrogenedentes bacterium]|nr:neutral/alkaline non-lysosomal ceramidase N-terminal domain-containing protein [Candidatus Hydrogenedentota bacterium]